ncbi:hypothetical protein CFC21_092600 [Triticum aestivum]|uniref:Uncharacterized protein n=3 Tax=Triticinae TaxID=1648030 RepID=A0A453NWW0_AEGTS|nr:uncharacterized protein LOC109754518 [Aegilops tauschii subsp. strangulata]XP_044419717.1 uncharacterized protein LOC123144576 [Triticum aestivum]KAF7089697.1 hypothetical protein CFC21_092600 [Triticum aestivum]
MADSQVEGLRKAYAAIMLNMAKESAARVLAAERSVAVLTGGIAAAKEDGVAALVRLKNIMEDRMKQVELQSLAHVRKITELQEQLHDARNTVTSLQVELQRANTELEEKRKTLAEERMNILPTCDKIGSNKSKISRSKVHLQNRSLSSKDKNTVCRVSSDAKENGAVVNMENLYHRGSDMPSFIARNKKRELYRNGCTQRIRALRQRGPAADSSKQSSKEASASNNHSKTGKSDSVRSTRQTRSTIEQILQTKFLANCKRKRGQRSRPGYKHDSSDVHVKTEDKSSGTSDENGCLLLLQALEHDLSPPNLFSGHSGEGLTDLKDDLLMGGKVADFNYCMASPGPIDAHAISNMRATRRKRSKMVRVFEAGCSESKSVPGNNLLRSTNEDTIFENGQSSERIDDHSDTSAINNASVLSDVTKILIHSSGANNDQFQSGDSSPLVFQSTKSQVDGEGELRAKHPDCRTPENNSAKKKEVKVDESCNLTSDRADHLIISSLEKEQSTKAASGVSVQPEGVRCIKYTFNRRKRKNVSLNSSSLVSLADKQESLAKPETQNHLVESPKADKQESQAKPETQNHLVESPKGDNQLAHVAQQLILLSELKW